MYPQPRFRRRGAFDKQVLGVRVRQAEREPVPLKLTEPRIKLMQAIRDRQVKKGHASYANDWRWTGTTVTQRVTMLIDARWAHVVDKHVELTATGNQILDGAL